MSSVINYLKRACSGSRDPFKFSEISDDDILETVQDRDIVVRLKEIICNVSNSTSIMTLKHIECHFNSLKPF